MDVLHGKRAANSGGEFGFAGRAMAFDYGYLFLPRAFDLCSIARSDAITQTVTYTDRSSTAAASGNSAQESRPGWCFLGGVNGVSLWCHSDWFRASNVERRTSSSPTSTREHVSGTRNRTWITTSIASIGLLVSVLSCAEKPIESGRRFVTSVPDDTLHETFSRTAHRITGVISSQKDSIIYVAQLGDSGVVQSIDLTRPNRGAHTAAADPQHLLLRRGTLPWIMGSGALLEQVLRRAKVLGDTGIVPITFVAGARTTDLFTVKTIGQDSVILTGTWGGRSQDVLHISVDGDGRVTGMTLPRARADMEPAE